MNDFCSKMYELENDKVSFVLSDKGSVKNLINKTTGHEYITFSERDTWKILPFEDEPEKPKCALVQEFQQKRSEIASTWLCLSGTKQR